MVWRGDLCSTATSGDSIVDKGFALPSDDDGGGGTLRFPVRSQILIDLTGTIVGLEHYLSHILSFPFAKSLIS